MSSNIEVQRICQFCNEKFTARTTVTKYCSHKCSQRAYKALKRAEKVKKSDSETEKKTILPFEQLRVKEFLTVREVAQLLNCSIRTVYNHVTSGTIPAVNLGQRMTRVKRSEVDKLFQQITEIEVIPKEKALPEIRECYHLTEIQTKYGISEKALHDLIKRNEIPKLKVGRYSYVPVNDIDRLLT